MCPIRSRLRRCRPRPFPSQSGRRQTWTARRTRIKDNSPCLPEGLDAGRHDCGSGLRSWRVAPPMEVLGEWPRRSAGQRALLASRKTSRPPRRSGGLPPSPLPRRVRPSPPMLWPRGALRQRRVRRLITLRRGRSTGARRTNPLTPELPRPLLPLAQAQHPTPPQLQSRQHVENRITALDV